MLVNTETFQKTDSIKIIHYYMYGISNMEAIQTSIIKSPSILFYRLISYIYVPILDHDGYNNNVHGYSSK